MKVVVQEVEGEGLESLMGKRITLMCSNYFYTGVLAGVNTTCVKLTDPAIVYDTGSWSKEKYEIEEALPTTIYVQTAAIEAFGELNA